VTKVKQLDFLYDPDVSTASIYVRRVR